MRYLFLLLIFCCLLGVTDSIPRIQVDMSSVFPHTAAASITLSSPNMSVKSAALGREGFSDPKSQKAAGHLKALAIRSGTMAAKRLATTATARMAIKASAVATARLATKAPVAATASVAIMDDVTSTTREKGMSAATTTKINGEIGEMPAVDSATASAQMSAASRNVISANMATDKLVTANMGTGKLATGNVTTDKLVTGKVISESASTESGTAESATTESASTESGTTESAVNKDMGADLQMSPSESLDNSVIVLFSNAASTVQTKKVAISATPLTASEQAMVDSIRNRLMNPQGLQFIGSAGLNWAGAKATAAGSGHVKGTPLNGFDLGLSADIPLNKKWSFRPKAEYAFEGFRPDVNGTAVSIHVAYFSLPLDMVYHSDWVSRRFFVGAGPYLAHALSGTYTFKGIDTDMRFGNNYPGGDNLRSMDYGVHMMAGLLLDKNFVLGTQVRWGLSDIAPSGNGSDIHTRSAGLFLMYVFRN